MDMMATSWLKAVGIHNPRDASPALMLQDRGSVFTKQNHDEKKSRSPLAPNTLQRCRARSNSLDRICAFA